MRILITNDDSVSANQLLPLVKWCARLGEVTVVVPRYEQSGKSHGIEIHSPFKVEKLWLDSQTSVYAVDSTPADCVRYALLGMGMSFDIVISGINKGFNIGTDINYSGTVAAVREANINNVPAIALSTCPEYYDKAIGHLDEIYAYFKEKKLMQIHSAYNVNVPASPKKILITRQGGPYYSDNFVSLGSGMVQANGHSVYVPSGDLSLDTDAVMSGYVSITPISVDLTDKAVFKKLSE